MSSQLDKLSRYTGINKFSSEDEKEFYKFLKNSSDINIHAFENNWPYILQATRNGQYKFYFKDSIVYFTLRFEKSSKNFVVIVNSLGPKRKDAILGFCSILKKEKIGVLLKNIDKKELPFWNKQGFIESIKPWSKYSFRDDNTFPLYIIAGKTIKNGEFNSDYKRLFKKFDKEDIQTEYYQSSYDLVTKTLLVKNATFLFNKGVDKKKEVIRAHSFFFDDSIKERIRLQHIKEGKLIGVSYLTKTNDIVFYNALFCNKEKDLTKYLLYCSMQYVFKKFPKVKFFSIQGSENEGQNFFKKRFNPSSSIEKTHLVKK